MTGNLCYISPISKEIGFGDLSTTRHKAAIPQWSAASSFVSPVLVARWEARKSLLVKRSAWSQFANLSSHLLRLATGWVVLANQTIHGALSMADTNPALDRAKLQHLMTISAWETEREQMHAIIRSIENDLTPEGSEDTRWTSYRLAQVASDLLADARELNFHQEMSKGAI